MPRSSPEVADVFRAHGPAFRLSAFADGRRKANAGHLSRGQLKVMRAVEACRTAALGGHVEQCAECSQRRIAYNSCRNRHCPKCQGAVAKNWLAARMSDLLPVPYYHLVFTLPAAIADIAYQNKRTLYGLLFKASNEAVMTIAADPKHLGAQAGLIAVLHTWGSAMTHHPHIHMIAPGGGFSSDGARWIQCRPGFFLPVRVLSRLFRRLFLEGLERLYRAGKLNFFGRLAPLASTKAFTDYITPVRKIDWVVYAKEPFAAPGQVLAYLSRYTHRIAIANSRIVKFENGRVAFRYKEYRGAGRVKQKCMSLSAEEFMRRFLIHVLPGGFHRIRHYGFLASRGRKERIEKARALIASDNLGRHPESKNNTDTDGAASSLTPPCPHCGGEMRILYAFEPDHASDYRQRGPPA